MTMCLRKKWAYCTWHKTYIIRCSVMYRVAPWWKMSVIDVLIWTWKSVGDAQISTQMSSKHRCDRALYDLSLRATTSPDLNKKKTKNMLPPYNLHSTWLWPHIRHLLATPALASTRSEVLLEATVKLWFVSLCLFCKFSIPQLSFVQMWLMSNCSSLSHLTSFPGASGLQIV